MDDSKPDNKYCKNCGAENDANVKFCKECGQSFQKSTKSTKKGIISNKIFLIAIVAVLIVVIGIGANYAYGNYKMSQMDNYMKQSNVYSDNASNFIGEATSIMNQTSPSQSDEDKAISDLNQAIWYINQSDALAQQAYGYAEGPYKDLLAVGMKKNNVYLEMLNSWQTRIADVKAGNTADAIQLKQQESSRLEDWNKYDDEYQAIKAQNPGMQEHIDKNWNTT